VTEIARARARGQWLHAPGGGDVLHHLLALQAQDVRTPALALQARGGELATSNARRLTQLGVGQAQADRAVKLIADRVPATRAELAEHLASHDVPVAGQAIVHLLARAAMQGRVALTPDRVFVALDLPKPPDRDSSLDELARRYYASHAGAQRDDLAYWSGLPLRDARPPASAPSELDDGPVPRVLIPAFDELLLGWRDRTPTVPSEHAKKVHPGGGILRPVILENGVAVGTWSASGESPF
jgi:hypothetical protein